MALTGLPIGRGEIWHRPEQKWTLIALAALMLVPLVGWLVPLAGWMSPWRYLTRIELPLLALVVAASLIAARRHAPIAQRLLVGTLVGVIGLIAYDATLRAGIGLGFATSFPLLHLESPATGLRLTWVAQAANQVHHWVGTAVLWAVAYALVCGKARWYFGVAWGMVMGLVVALMSLLPLGHQILVAPSAAGLAVLAGAHVFFGAVIGALNELLQQAPTGAGKIVFLRDYTPARIKQKK